MRRNLRPAIVLLCCIGLACSGCATTYPVGIDDRSRSQERVIDLHDLRKGDELTATMQSGAVKHFRLVSFDNDTLSGKRLVLGIDGIERLEVRRNNVLHAAGKVSRIVGEVLVLGAVDSVARQQDQMRIDQP